MELMASEGFVPSRRATDAARALFLRSVQRLAPEVLDSLRDEVLPAYRKLPPKLMRKTSRGPSFLKIRNVHEVLYQGEEPQYSRVDLPDVLLYSNLAQLKSSFPQVGRLQNGLLAWAHRYHLDRSKDNWLLDTTLQTLNAWRKRDPSAPLKSWPPGARMPLGFQGITSVTGAVISENERSFVFNTRGWEIEFESFQAFKTRLETEMSEKLNQYKACLEELATQRGWKRPPEIRNPLQFDWLALYQVKSTSPAKILRPQDENTVFIAVKKAALLIGLELRPRKRDLGKLAPKSR